MPWLKQNPHLAVLSVCAVLLIAVSGWVISSASSFNSTFDPARSEPRPNPVTDKLDLAPLQRASATLLSPKAWKPISIDNEPVLMYVSDKYLAGETPDMLTKLSIDGKLYPPVPNAWVVKYGISLPGTKSSVLQDDLDGDGFSNFEEFLGNDHLAGGDDGGKANDSTDPTDKKSHPAFFTKLRLKQWIRIPFRLRFNAYDGDGKRDKPESMSYQINTLDLRQPSVFLKLGQKVPRTQFKLQKFEYKTEPHPNLGEKDASELTLINEETSDTIVLVLNAVRDSPSSYAAFEYFWPNRATPEQIGVQRLREFTLKTDEAVTPEVTARNTYKLIDVTDTEAVIQAASGPKITIKKKEKYEE